MNVPESINRYLDALPRPRLSALGREVPTFRTCGVAGFYVALIVLIGAGLVTGRSLTVLTIMALVSALSFYAYTYLRRWITGFEELVLLEHVWFAMACNTATLYLLSVPVVSYLDVMCLALCPFLAAGRVGCTLVGCCHGNPSRIGITYNDDCVRDGFSPHLAGVRLFPVQIIEAGGLLLIGVTGLLALPFAAPGRVLAWYLLAYAVMRFGLEGIRSDYRPHLLGTSQARWMCLIEVGLALALLDRGPRSAKLTMAVLIPMVLGMLLLGLRDRHRRLLSVSHLRKVRELAFRKIESEAFDRSIPALEATSGGVSVAVSAAGYLQGPTAHISLGMPKEPNDLRLHCELAARAFPGMIFETAHFSRRRVLHFIAPWPLPDVETGAKAGFELGERLYGGLARRLQKSNGRYDADPDQAFVAASRGQRAPYNSRIEVS